MKYQVAVVEDELSEVERMKDYFLRFGQQQGAEFLLEFFSSGEDFLVNYKPIYDIVLMDICLPNINGMDTAFRMRKIDQAVTLIFMTNMAQYAVKGYEVNAFDYILKPVSYAGFSLKLQRTLNQLSFKQEEELLITHDDICHRIASSQIKYVEISGHDMVIHTTKEDISAYGNLKRLEAKLNPKRFVRCNSCYLVNLSFVRSVQGQSVLIGDASLQISLPRRKQFIQALNSYLGEGV